MRPLVSRLKKFTDHPVTKLVLGLILMVSSGAEAYETLFDDMSHFRFRAHHGLFLFAFMNVLAAIPDLVEGLEEEIEILERRDEPRAGGRLAAREQPLARRDRARAGPELGLADPLSRCDASKPGACLILQACSRSDRSARSVGGPFRVLVPKWCPAKRKTSWCFANFL
jgi:hypothetical protein